MSPLRPWQVVVVFAAATSTLGFVTSPASKLDSAWKRYHNPEWGYCVSYPSRWIKGDAFDGAGIFFESGPRKHTRPIGEIDIVAVASRADDSPRPRPASLTDDLETHLEGLRKFERAEQLEIVEQHSLNLRDASALFTKDRYYDPLDRGHWVDEIVFARRKSTLYRLEMECRADQLERFERVFTQMLQSFEFECQRGR